MYYYPSFQKLSSMRPASLHFSKNKNDRYLTVSRGVRVFPASQVFVLKPRRLRQSEHGIVLFETIRVI